MKVKELPKPYETSAMCKDCGALLEIVQSDIVYGYIGYYIGDKVGDNERFYFVCGNCEYHQELSFVPEYIKRILIRKSGKKILD